MLFKVSPYSRLFLSLLIVVSLILFGACNKDDDKDGPLESTSFQYEFHNGQSVPSAPYAGVHESTVTAELKLEELANGRTKITVTIENTLDGATYHVHAHDAANPSTTPNGTPYDETPNASIFAQALIGNGGVVSTSQETDRSYDELINTYEGFFVIHDPLQAISTVDLSTFLIVGSFARKQAEVNFASSTFEYAFNTGQLVSDFAYTGTHNNNLSARITVGELADNKSRITVHIMNTLDGETYHTHAHDVADPATTPNGTPYNETPNVNVFVAPIIGNGGTAVKAVISSMDHQEITTAYEGFFVIHDPLQAITTVDPTTYIILGSFAR